MSVTDNLALLHDFQPFAVAEEVGAFLNNNDSIDAVTLEARGKGYLYILSDQGTTMRWETVYTPNGSGTVLSPDNYLNNNDKIFYSFNHRGTRQNTGEITFTNNRQGPILSGTFEAILGFVLCHARCGKNRTV